MTEETFNNHAWFAVVTEDADSTHVSLSVQVRQD
jgi:hypothetical protein